MYSYQFEKRFLFDYILPPSIASIATLFVLISIYFIKIDIFLENMIELHLMKFISSFIMVLCYKNKSIRKKYNFIKKTLKDPILSEYTKSIFSRSYNAYNLRQYYILGYSSIIIFFLFAIIIITNQFKVIRVSNDFIINLLITKEIFLYSCLQIIYFCFISIGIKKHLKEWN